MNKNTKKTKIEIKKAQLKTIFQSLVIYEILKENLEGESHQFSKVYNEFSTFFTDSEKEKIINKSYELLDEYIALEDLDMIDEILDKEKELVMKIVAQDKSENLIGLKESNDLFQEIKNKFSSASSLKLVIHKKEQND